MKNHCLVCGNELKGIADKKFCSDNCRVDYYNTQNRALNNYMRNVNNVLRKNRRILQRLNPNGKSKVHEDILREKGFKFNYITNIYLTKSGKTYFFFYDQGYLKIDQGWYALVQKEDYVRY